MKQKILDALIPAALLAVLATGLQTWREVAVLQSQVESLSKQIELLEKFVASDDPRVFQEAARQIRENREKQ